MNCPQCGTHQSAWRVLSAKGESLKCESCGKAGQVKGINAFLAAPMVLFLFFPFRFLDDNRWAQEIVFLSGLAFFCLSYYLFIRIEWLSEPEEKEVGSN